MRLILDSRFKRNVRGRFGKYNFEVGVLEDKPYLNARRGERGQKGQDVITNYAGGPVRRKSKTLSGQNISDVSKSNRERLGFNYLSEPFKKRSSDIVRFSKEFFKLAFGRSEKRRAENLLQAIVRNPILRGEYGPQGELTTKIKGFSRPMIDTAQLFKAIKSVCKVRGR
jgi:hypothetical protein